MNVALPAFNLRSGFLRDLLLGAIIVLFSFTLFYGVIHLRPILSKPAFFYLPLIFHLLALAMVVATLFRESLRRVPLTVLNGGLLFLLLMLFGGLTLQLLWGYHINTRWATWGAFPINDAADYLNNTGKILTEGTFNSIRGRPLANLLLTGQYLLSDFDNRLFILINTVLSMVSIWMVSAAIWARFGPGIALIMASILFDYIHEHLTAFSSEPLGFFVGCAAFTLLWYAVGRRSALLLLAGLGTLFLAQFIRVGPLFIFPAIVLWALMRNKPIFSWSTKRMILTGLLIFFAIYGLNSHITNRLTNGSATFANAINSWYYVFVRGRVFLDDSLPTEYLNETLPWLWINKEYPQLKGLPVDQEVAEKKRIIIDQIIHHPVDGIVGSALEIYDTLFPVQLQEFSDDHWRSLMFRSIDPYLINMLLYLMMLLGMGVLIQRHWRLRQNDYEGFILSTNLGIMLSAPFMVGGETRAIASVFPFMALLPLFGLHILIKRMHRTTDPQQTPLALSSTPVFVSGTFLVAVSVAIPLTLFTAVKGYSDIKGIARDQLAGRCHQKSQIFAINYRHGTTLALHQKPILNGLIGPAYTTQDLVDHFNYWSLFYTTLPEETNSNDRYSTRSRSIRVPPEIHIGYFSAYRNVLKLLKEGKRVLFYTGLDMVEGKKVELVFLNMEEDLGGQSWMVCASDIGEKSWFVQKAMPLPNLTDPSKNP
ncbi:MAG: hypothetical protein HQL50_10700 [Magnetococcales bacterium]|nr:hypothetical protein [Magnetococcales bacterium]